VSWLARDRGIRQFLDVGTGIPGAGNTHEIALGWPAPRAVRPGEVVEQPIRDGAHGGRECLDGSRREGALRRATEPAVFRWVGRFRRAPLSWAQGAGGLVSSLKDMTTWGSGRGRELPWAQQQQRRRRLPARPR
jgi:CubicO group peptidase (beta-lactamase class C family)